MKGTEENNMVKISKRMLAIILSLVMVMTLLPVVRPVEVKAGATLVWPVPGHTSLSQEFHDGNAIDISDSSIYGANIVAAMGGVVQFKFTCSGEREGGVHNYYDGCPAYVNNCRGFGTGLVIQGDDGRIYQYAHMVAGSISSGINVGRRVAQGQIIGKVGQTGNATGPHLHFGISIGKYFNQSGINPWNEKYIGRDEVAKPRVEPQANTYKDDYNIAPRANVYNPNRSKITTCGIQIKDGNTVIASKEEIFDTKANTVSNGEIFYDCRSELGITLRPGHTYTWNIYAYVGGIRVETGWQTIKTTGTEKPNKPTFTTTKRNYAVGDAATISWGKDNNATKGYSVTLTPIEGGTYKQTLTTNNANATTLAFTLPSEGEYQITGYAMGSSNSDTSTMSGVVTAHGQKNVKFIETFDDGSTNILWQGTVKYGYSATAPMGISRKGHTFLGWDKEYNNITTDTTITAQFKRNTYKVSFYDKDNNVINTQSILYEGNAVEPTPPEAEAGYVFAGWDNEDWKNVQGNVKVKACYVWANDDLPVVVSINKCEFKEDGYVVSYNIKNNPNKKTKGRALVSLRTSTGKLLDTTESNAFSLAKGEERNNVEMYIPYEGAATNVSIYIIDGFSNGIPISETANIEVTRDWSDWSAEKPGDNVEVEERAEYRHKDLLTTTTRTSVNEGWNLINTVLDSNWSYGSWSGWSRSAITANSTTTTIREVESKNVSDNNSYTRKTYYFYKDPNRLSFSYYDEWNAGKYYEYSEDSNKSPRMYVYGSYGGLTTYRLNNNNGGYGIYFDWEVWWLKNSTNYPATTHKEYRYRDGSKGYTYYWNKWDEWSDWSPESITANDTRQVDTRTTYRYRAKMSDLEDNTGKKYTVSGKVNSSLAGKEALIQVYKGDNPSDSNNEYIGRVTIKADGSYSHTFVAREEISVKTGDYTVMMAIEGGSEPIYLDTIEAPKPEYTVIFKDINGKIIKTQKVKEGKSASAPKAPQVNNYTFIGWDFGVTNIRDNMEITAQYTRNKYSVAFVNWDTREVETEIFSYGDPIIYPEESNIEGYDFIGWTTTDGKTISNVVENTVLIANYKIQTYTINFYDANQKLLSSQKVDYGMNAEVPEEPQIDKMVFLGWSSYGFIQAKGDLDVYPTYEYIETTPNPTCDLESCSLKDSTDVHLFAEDGAEIYYTTDGTIPSKISNKYDGKITIDKNTFLQYIAVSPDKNYSEIMNASYLLISSEDDEGALVIKKDTYNIERGKSVELTYFLSHNNPDMEVEYYSLNEDVASVDEEGNIRANQVGEARIFVRTKDCKYADYCDVIVTTDEIDAESIVLNEYSISALIDTTAQLQAEVYPSNTTEKEVDWYSEDSNVATVDENGKVELIGEGSTVIRAMAKTGTCYAECVVNSSRIIQAKQLYISDNIVSLEKGKTQKLEAYADGEVKECEWYSINETIATVDEKGVVTAIEPGYTTIYAYTGDGLTASCTVIVENSNQIETKTTNKQEVTTKEESTTEKQQPIEVKGLTIASIENGNKVSFTWNETDEQIALGQTYNVYYDGELYGNFIGSKTLTNIFDEDGMHKITVKAVLNGVETEGQTALVQTLSKETTTQKTLETPTKEVVTTTEQIETSTKEVVTTTKPAETTTKNVATPTKEPTTTGKITKNDLPIISKPNIKKLKNVKGKKVKLKLAKLKVKYDGYVASGVRYEVMYAKNSKFTKGKKIKKYNGSIYDTSKTITKLKKKKTYWIKVRVRIEYLDATSSKAMYKYSAWSIAKKVKIKK